MTRARRRLGAWCLIAAGTLASAQNLPYIVKQGEKVFNQTCATGYCHGVKGAAGAAVLSHNWIPSRRITVSSGFPKLMGLESAAQVEHRFAVLATDYHRNTESSWHV